MRSEASFYLLEATQPDDPGLGWAYAVATLAEVRGALAVHLAEDNELYNLLTGGELWLQEFYLGTAVEEYSLTGLLRITLPGLAVLEPVSDPPAARLLASPVGSIRSMTGFAPLGQAAGEATDELMRQLATRLLVDELDGQPVAKITDWTITISLSALGLEPLPGELLRPGEQASAPSRHLDDEDYRFSYGWNDPAQAETAADLPADHPWATLVPAGQRVVFT